MPRQDLPCTPRAWPGSAPPRRLHEPRNSVRWVPASGSVVHPWRQFAGPSLLSRRPCGAWAIGSCLNDHLHRCRRAIHACSRPACGPACATAETHARPARRPSPHLRHPAARCCRCLGSCDVQLRARFDGVGTVGSGVIGGGCWRPGARAGGSSSARRAARNGGRDRRRRPWCVRVRNGPSRTR